MHQHRRPSPLATPQISHLPHLQKITLPFALDASALRHLATLPALSELYTWSSVHLDGAAPPAADWTPAAVSILSAPPVVLPSVTKLVASAIRADAADSLRRATDHPRPRHELDAVFPGLRSLYVKRGCDAQLALAAGCGARLETLVLHSAARASDGGVALLRACRGLQRLQIEDAPRVSDEGLARLFAVPVPSLQHLALHRVPQLGDASMLAATAMCRRLVSASLACCAGLTDKTLSRMARMEHLAHVQLVKLGAGVTAEGVRILAAAPAMRRCMSPPAAACKGAWQASQARHLCAG